MPADEYFEDRGLLEPRRHHDPLAVRTVFVAPKRAGRPIDADAALHPSARLIDCPFCAGNEALTPPAVLQVPATGRWQARIIPNRYPVVEDFLGKQPAGSTTADRRPAHGVHDVVIEAADHVRSILAVDPAHWQDVWELCRQRLAALADRSDLAWATVFKNSGPRAGASLEHLHSQLIALDFVPPVIEAELAAAGRAADAFGDIVRAAEAGGRVVAEQDDLVAFVPHAIRQPYETWIMPRSPEAWFHATSPARVAALAMLTQLLIARLDRIVPGADYNWWLHQAPFASHAGGHWPSVNWHWHLEILPRLASFAGFELGTGCHITVATPEDSARLLRV